MKDMNGTKLFDYCYKYINNSKYTTLYKDGFNIDQRLTIYDTKQVLEYLGRCYPIVINGSFDSRHMKNINMDIDDYFNHKYINSHGNALKTYMKNRLGTNNHIVIDYIVRLQPTKFSCEITFVSFFRNEKFDVDLSYAFSRFLNKHRLVDLIGTDFKYAFDDLCLDLGEQNE
jgi:hypothetical protein